MPVLLVRPKRILAEARLRGGFGALSRSIETSTRDAHESTRTRGAPCPCAEGVAEVFRRIGMPRAAAMHLEGDRLWGPEDWRPHAEEEDREFFPRLRAIARTLEDQQRTSLLDEVDDLQREHDEVVYPAVDRGEVPSDEFTRRHGAREDALVRRWAARLLEDAGVSTEVRTGIDLMLATIPEKAKVAEAPPAWTMEKFLDPRWSDGDVRCKIRPPLEYLYDATGPIANDRVEAMRIRVEAHRASGLGRGVAPLAEQSHDSLVTTAMNLYDGYAAAAADKLSPEQLKTFAQKLGKTVPEIVSKSTPSFVQQLGDAKVRELGAAVWKLVGPDIMHVVKSISDEVGGLTSGAGAAASGLGDVAKAIPVIGMVVSYYVGAVDDWATSRSAEWQKFCRDFVDKMIAAPFEKTLKLGYPYPWHVWDLDLACAQPDSAWDPTKPVSKWDATDNQRLAADMLSTNLRRMTELEDNLAAVSNVRRWWTLAMQLMGYGDVAAIFSALGSSAGAYASDEQVLLVAAPVAASYGFSPWDFARFLYQRSQGWRDPEFYSLMKAEPRKQWHYTDDGDIESDPPICGSTLVNAAQVQWAVLARDAFKLAEDAKNGLVPGLHPIGYEPPAPPSAIARAAVPLAIGAAGGAIALAAGVATGAALIPLGAALLWVILEQQTKDAPQGYLVASSAAPARSPALEGLTIARTGRASLDEPIVDVSEIESVEPIDDHDDGTSPYDLHHADASRYKAWEQLLLLEDHVNADPCPDCMMKHLGCAAGLLKEAATLVDGDSRDVAAARYLLSFRTRIRSSLAEFRELRKQIGIRLGLGHLQEAGVDRAHAPGDCGCGKKHAA